MSVFGNFGVWEKIKVLKRLWIYFFFFWKVKYHNHVVLFSDFGLLQRRVEVSFCSIPFLLCSEGHSGCAWKWLWREHWKVFRRARGKSSACLIKNLLNFGKVYFELHTQRHTLSLSHLNRILPLYDVQAHCVVCAFHSRQYHHNFPWYYDSNFLFSFKLQNHFLFWKKNGKEIALEVDWSGSAC